MKLSLGLFGMNSFPSFSSLVWAIIMSSLITDELKQRTKTVTGLNQAKMSSLLIFLPICQPPGEKKIGETTNKFGKPHLSQDRSFPFEVNKISSVSNLTPMDLQITWHLLSTFKT